MEGEMIGKKLCTCTISGLKELILSFKSFFVPGLKIENKPYFNLLNEELITSLDTKRVSVVTLLSLSSFNSLLTTESSPPLI